MPVDDDPDGLEAVLEYLKSSRGFDFTGYKRTSIGRRVSRRMETVGIATYSEYLDHLEVHPDEFAALFNTILINVTSFFRDADAWTYLADEIVPRLLADAPHDGQIRVWS